jgi:hypothetical protein
VSIAHDEIAVLCSAFRQAMAGYLQQRRVGIECNDMTYGLSTDVRESLFASRRVRYFSHRAVAAALR